MPSGPDPSTVELAEVDPDSPGARAALAAYVAELDTRFPDGFDPGEPDQTGVFVLATSAGRPVAYGGVRPLPDLPDGMGERRSTGEIKRMWVAADWRGVGLGSRMLRHLEALAVRLGHDRVVLDTNGTLTEAIAMYDRAGYRRIERYNDNPHAEAFFEKHLPQG